MQTILTITMDDLVDEVNQEVVGQAERFVFACDTSQTRFVQNRFGRRKTNTLFEDLEEVRAADRARQQR